MFIAISVSKEQGIFHFHRVRLKARDPMVVFNETNQPSNFGIFDITPISCHDTPQIELDLELLFAFGAISFRNELFL